jgi:hypothetical protein
VRRTDVGARRPERGGEEKERRSIDAPRKQKRAAARTFDRTMSFASVLNERSRSMAPSNRITGRLMLAVTRRE